MYISSLLFSAEVYGELYAFQYRPDSDKVKQTSGWMLYDAPVEYKRMGVPNQHWQATHLNSSYEVGSHPSPLLPLLSSHLSPLNPLSPHPSSSVTRTAAISMSQPVLTMPSYRAVPSSAVKADSPSLPSTTTPSR